MSGADERSVRPIVDLLADAKRANQAAGKAFVYANAYKPHREAWALGHFAALYNNWDRRVADLVLAHYGETADVPADFAVLDGSGAHVAHVEITTALDPGRRPGAEYRDPNRPRTQLVPDPCATGVDPWCHLCQVLGQKIAKGQARYAPGTWLVVYMIVFASMYGDESDPIEAAERVIAGYAPGEMGLAEIWLLDGEDVAHRVYPSRVTLRSRS